MLIILGHFFDLNVYEDNLLEHANAKHTTDKVNGNRYLLDQKVRGHCFDYVRCVLLLCVNPTNHLIQAVPKSIKTCMWWAAVLRCGNTG